MAKEARPDTARWFVHKLIATPEFANSDRINLNEVLVRLQETHGLTPNAQWVQRLLGNRGIGISDDANIRKELKSMLSSKTDTTAQEAHKKLQEKGIKTTEPYVKYLIYELKVAASKASR
ncbi:hypothetical protein J4220_00615 [Candidatus Micrarchaeota archaeon]|nr:hypothetical protein [Candidatus Micrarchaeota archaeon]